MDGFEVGLALGLMLGKSVGELLGTWEGESLGLFEGICDKVGLSDGAAEGCAVGEPWNHLLFILNKKVSSYWTHTNDLMYFHVMS